MRKKYIFLFLIIIILLFIAFFVFKEKEHTNGTDALAETAEKVSKDYKITDESVSVNFSQADNSGEIANNMETNQNLKLISPAFANQENIPAKYTCDGDNINPPFEIFGVRADAKSLVLIMDDPDAPMGTWDHWIKFNMPVATKKIEEGREPEGISGQGTGGTLNYAGPCPPGKQHRYFFKLYALDTELVLPEGSAKTEIEKALEGHILQTTELMGVYERKTKTKIE